MSPNDPEDELLRMFDAGKALGVTPRTIRNWNGKGLIRVSYTAGGHLRVRRSEINRILAGSVPSASVDELIPEEIIFETRSQEYERVPGTSVEVRVEDGAAYVKHSGG